MSLQPDMKFGWKPKEEISGAPIPLYYDFEPFEVPINPQTNEEYIPVYLGPRHKHSLNVHKMFANKNGSLGEPTYPFKFPGNLSMIEAIMKSIHRQEEPREFIGMNPLLSGD